MTSPEESLRNALCEARSYREFLRLYFMHTGRSYAEVARRAGFSSRSYPRDVTEGRRRLTARALPSLTRGLRLDARLSELFQTLYFLEYPHELVTPSGGQGARTMADLGSRLTARTEKARRRARNGKVRSNAAEKVPLVVPESLREMAIRHLFEVLASLGNADVGATLEEASRMTGFQKPSLSTLLGFAEREGLLRFDTRTNRYFPVSAHLNLTGMPKHDLIRAIFMHSLERVKTAAANAYDSDSALFFVSAISVSQANLPQMKRELREVLLKYADEKAESETSPDTVISIVGSMFEGRIAPA